MYFLQKYSLILKVLSLVGFCCFRVNKFDKKVEYKFRFIFYAICNLTFIAIISSIILWNNLSISEINTIEEIVDGIELFVGILLHKALIACSIISTKAQLKFINTLENIKTCQYSTLGTKEYKTFFKLFYKEFWILFAIISPVNFMAISLYVANKNLLSKINWLMFGLSNLTIHLQVIHIRNMCRLLLLRVEKSCTSLTWLLTQETKCKTIMNLFEQSTSLLEFKQILRKCFGMQLVFMAILDFILLVASCYHILYIIDNENGIHFKVIIFIIAYQCPLVYKNFLLVLVMAKTENWVC